MATISRVPSKCLSLDPQLVKQNLPNSFYQMAEDSFLFFNECCLIMISHYFLELIFFKVKLKNTTVHMTVM